MTHELLSGPNLAGLMTLPGIGEKRATLLAQAYQTWDAFIRAQAHELTDLLGNTAGHKTAQHLPTEPLVAVVPPGVNVVSTYEDHYPQSLQGLTDKPTLLWWQGTLPNMPLVAVVGTRTPHPFGLQVAQHAACRGAANNIATCSGLALGVDLAAHNATLDEGLPSWAVVGQGHATLPVNGPRAETAQRIVTNGGGILSEVPPTTPIAAHLLTHRNRLQTGLAHAVVIAQTGLGSPTKAAGTMHTAKYALSQRVHLAVAEPPPGLAARDDMAGNVALTNPAGINPDLMYISDPVFADRVRTRTPAADQVLRSVDDFDNLWSTISAP